MKQNVFSVSSLVHYLKQTLDNDSNIRSILIKGEISNFTNHRSGHWYFTLKDAKSRISCVMFASYASRCRFLPKEGTKVIVSASVSMYEAGGSLQLYVNGMQADGLGDLFLQLEQIKKKLSMEGLFDPNHKKSLPVYPMRIGVISARTGAAIQDILTTISRRWPLAEVCFYPSLVQGISASEDIIKNLMRADADGHDVILLARGGGSIEDLWCFNDEKLARCIYAMHTVIVTGVGHETDTTLVDYVSDARAPTPTAAAELITPNISEVGLHIMKMKTVLVNDMKHRLEKEKAALKPLQEHRYMKDPLSYVADSQMKLAMHVKELSIMEHQVHAWSQKLSSLSSHLGLYAKKIEREKMEDVKQKQNLLFVNMEHYKQKANENYMEKVRLLDAFSPLKILTRGYTLTYREEHLVKSIQDVEEQDALRIRMQDGYIHTKVTKKEEL